MEREIIDRIKSVRDKKNLTQGEFANKLGVSRNMIGLLESKRQTPTLELIRRVYHHFNVSLEFIIDGEKPMLVRSRVETVSVNTPQQSINNSQL